MRRTKTRGFTLVEILIVIAVVGVLAAILFPVFARVREAGRRTVCLSHLTQLALGMQQYVADNNGRYPARKSPDGENIEMGVLIDSDVNQGPFGWQYAVFPYIRTGGVFGCPSQVIDPRENHAFNPVYPLSSTDYVFNSGWLNKLVAASDGNTFIVQPDGSRKRVIKVGRKEAALTNPAAIWLNTDRGYVGESRTGMVLHSGGANYSFCDGHVKWLTPQGINELLRSASGVLYLPPNP